MTTLLTCTLLNSVTIGYFSFCLSSQKWNYIIRFCVLLILLSIVFVRLKHIVSKQSFTYSVIAEQSRQPTSYRPDILGCVCCVFIFLLAGMEFLCHGGCIYLILADTAKHSASD